jgi:hypothetical protein
MPDCVGIRFRSERRALPLASRSSLHMTAPGNTSIGDAPPRLSGMRPRLEGVHCRDHGAHQGGGQIELVALIRDAEAVSGMTPSVETAAASRSAAREAIRRHELSAHPIAGEEAAGE